MLGPFHTIVVGVDGSEASLVALDQAARLLAPRGHLVAVVVGEEHLSAQAGFEAPHAAAELVRESEAAMDAARRALAGLPGAEVRLAHGRRGPMLRSVADEVDADLIVLGSHDRKRLAAMVFGSVVDETLHAWPRRTLVARPGGDAFTAIVVGYDGSPAAGEAVRVADEIGASLGIPVHPVLATSGGRLRPDSVPVVPELSVDEREPVGALVAACRATDLLVVGARGLNGLAAARSVSERVVHRAPCSVLVLRHGATGAGRPLVRRRRLARRVPA